MFNDDMTRGCDDGDVDSGAQHADELDKVGEDLMTKFLELAPP
jgi:hypothetical protein